MLSTFVLLLLCLSLSLVLKELFHRFKFPEVVGQILAGSVLSLPFFGTLMQQSSHVIEFLSNLGILFLLFLAGMEIDVRKILSTCRDSILIAISSAVIPFLLGFAFLHCLGYDFFTCLIFGIALSVTAEGTKVKVLMDMKKLNTKLGAIMLGAGAFDDVIEVLGLSIVTALKFGEIEELLFFPVELLVFGVIVFLAFKLLPRILKYLEKKETDVELFGVVFIFMLLLAALSEALEMGYLIGAITAGLLLQLAIRKMKRENKYKLKSSIRLITLSFFAPFFFIEIGAKLSVNVFLNPLLFVGGVAIATLGKIGGTMIIKPFSELSPRQLYVIGWGMNSRGAVELVIALVAFQAGLITSEIFSLITAIAILTTLTFPFVMQYEIRRHPKLFEG